MRSSANKICNTPTPHPPNGSHRVERKLPRKNAPETEDGFHYIQHFQEIPLKKNSPKVSQALYYLPIGSYRVLGTLSHINHAHLQKYWTPDLVLGGSHNDAMRMPFLECEDWRFYQHHVFSHTMEGVSHLHWSSSCQWGLRMLTHALSHCFIYTA